MDYVQVPLNIAQRAARVYRPLLPYVRKFIAEHRQKQIVEPTKIKDLSGFVIDEFEQSKQELESKEMDELLAMAKENKIKTSKLTKDELILKLLGQ